MRLVSLCVCVAASLSSAALWSPAVRADAIREIGRPAPVVPPSAYVVPPMSVRILTIAQVDFPSEFEHDRGDISRVRSVNAIEIDRPLDAKWNLRFEAEFEADLYKLRGTRRVVAGSGSLLDTGIRTHLEPGLDWRFRRDWKIGADVAFETLCVPGASLEDSYTVGESFYVWHRFSPSFALSFGISIYANLGDAPLIVPFAAPDDIDATSSGRWRFEGRGTGGRLGYAFTPTLTAGLSGIYDRRDWRLAPDSRVPGGIARDIRVTFGLFADVSRREGFTFGLEVGMTVFHEFEVVDRRGDDVAQVGGSPAAYAGFSLSWRF